MSDYIAFVLFIVVLVLLSVVACGVSDYISRAYHRRKHTKQVLKMLITENRRQRNYIAFLESMNQTYK